MLTPLPEAPGRLSVAAASAGVLVHAPAKMPEEIPAGTLNQMPKRQVNNADTPTITADMMASLLPCLARAEAHAVYKERQTQLPYAVGNGQAVVAGGQRHEKNAGKAQVQSVYFNAAESDAEKDDSKENQGVVLEQDIKHKDG